MDFELKPSGTKDQVLITTLDGLSKNPVPHHHHQSMGKPDILHHIIWASLVAQSVTNPPAMQETRVQFLGWEDPLEKEMATHSSILAWEISWTEEPGGLQSMGSQEATAAQSKD